jgi:hypothetical protein
VVSQVVAVNPQLPATLQTLLGNGEWGNAFIGLVQDIRTPIQIIIASIDSIFGWDEVSVPTAPAACRNSYIQEITDLLQLPSGIRLFRDIIIAHHCVTNLSKVKFISNSEESSATSFRSSRPCEINLTWDGISRHHVGSERMVVARNSTLPVVGGDPNTQLDFVIAHVPPSIVLAHELGHYLDDLEACKKIMDSANHVGIVSDAIAIPNDLGIKISHERDIYNIEWGGGAGTLSPV